MCVHEYRATAELTATEIGVGAGVRYCDIDEDGNMAVNMDTEEVINTIDKLKQCFYEIQPDIERTGFIIEVLNYLSVEMVRPAIYE